MALYFYFNSSTGDLVYSDKSSYSGSGYTSVGEQLESDPVGRSYYVFDSIRSQIKTVSKDTSIEVPINKLKSMSYMFSSCDQLTGADLSMLDTSNVTDMQYMFDGCASIISLDLTSFDTSNVTDMSYMFRNCSSIVDLNISTWNTQQVTTMSNMFYRCSQLKSIDLSSFDTSNVKSMYYMFNYCSSLTELDVTSFDTKEVTDMNSMFQRCSSLTHLDLSLFDTSKVSYMSSMFMMCQSLTELDLSSFDTSHIKNMSYMFAYCNKLKYINLSSFDTSNTTEMAHMFFYCTELTSIDLSSFDTQKVTSTSNMFTNCTSLRIVYISDKISNILSELPSDQYYPAAGGEPVAKASLTEGTWVRDEADLTLITSLVQQAQMSTSINHKLVNQRRSLIDKISRNFVSFGPGSELPSGADLNKYTTPGMYYCRSSEVALTLLNRPTSVGSFILIVLGTEIENDQISVTSFPLQILITSAFGSIYTRGKENTNNSSDPFSDSTWKYVGGNTQNSGIWSGSLAQGGTVSADNIKDIFNCSSYLIITSKKDKLIGIFDVAYKSDIFAFGVRNEGAPVSGLTIVSVYLSADSEGNVTYLNGREMTVDNKGEITMNLNTFNVNAIYKLA